MDTLVVFSFRVASLVLLEHCNIFWVIICMSLGGTSLSPSKLNLLCSKPAYVQIIGIEFKSFDSMFVLCMLASVIGVLVVLEFYHHLNVFLLISAILMCV
jgi:hypothetical protein